MAPALHQLQIVLLRCSSVFVEAQFPIIIARALLQRWDPLLPESPEKNSLYFGRPIWSCRNSPLWKFLEIIGDEGFSESLWGKKIQFFAL